MKIKMLTSAAALLVLISGQAMAAPSIGGTGSGTPSMGASPGSITGSTDGTGASNTSNGMGYSGTINEDNANSMGAGSSTFNDITPSSGASFNTSIYAGAPSNMSSSRFKTYLNNEWGVGTTSGMTESQWNDIDPAYFNGDKPAFSSLSNGRSTISRTQLQPIYSRLYNQYNTNGSPSPSGTSAPQ